MIILMEPVVATEAWRIMMLTDDGGASHRPVRGGVAADKEQEGRNVQEHVDELDKLDGAKNVTRQLSKRRGYSVGRVSSFSERFAVR
jgi:hypothetical protein